VEPGLGKTDPGSTVHSPDRMPFGFWADSSDAFLIIRNFLRSLDFKSSPPKGGVSDLKCGREQQHRAQWNKEDGNTRIVFKMP
jgi:hypothetical protein